MRAVELNNPYETAYWKTSSGIMRPGGLELTRRLLELSGLKKGARILDLGCGYGVATDYLEKRGFKAVGMDQSQALIKHARGQCPHVTFVRGDAAAMPFAHAAFDAVLMECVLSVVPIGETLAECARITNAQGRLLITDVYSRDSITLSREWWESQLAANGFHCVYFEDRTRDLHSFAAQQLWDTGSLNDLCSCMGRIMPSKPGYLAMIAEKGGR